MFEETGTIHSSNCYIGRLLDSYTDCFCLADAVYELKDLSDDDITLLSFKILGFDNLDGECQCVGFQFLLYTMQS